MACDLLTPSRPEKMNRSVGSIALLNPLADFGITAYTHELARSISAHGVAVDVYCHEGPLTRDLPRGAGHQCFPVLGNWLFRQRPSLASKGRSGSSSGQRSPVSKIPKKASSKLRGLVRSYGLGIELIWHLKKKGYEAVWTQWPDMLGDQPNFWKLCKVFGLKTIHTVHNILPHEPSADDIARYSRVYSNCDLLFVHSEHVKRQFLTLFPDLSANVKVMRHGLYTVFPRRTEARHRVRRKYSVTESQTVLLCCGSIRPYKNIDAVIQAMSGLADRDAVLVVSGKESHYPDSCPETPLCRTERLAREWGILDRIRLIPGFLSLPDMADLFEASDILVLPYLEGYGSGMLCLGMTFHKYILATAVGGADEYLRNYSRHTLLAGSSGPALLEGIQAALASPNLRECSERPALKDLEWKSIAQECLKAIATIM
jgi:glycosyltransferase involved in cell wall biosynthesis